MRSKRILVVLGGTSEERAISLNSGNECIKAMKKIGYKVSIFDPKKNLYKSIDRKKVDLIFNALHGKDGEDGVAQSYFECLKIPYTHSGVISSFNAMNKVISKKIFIKHKIKTPNYFVFSKNNFNKIGLLKSIVKNKFTFPVVTKPISEGSSIGVKICKNFKDLFKFSNILFKKYSDLIFEPYVGGKEIQVAVINGSPIGAIELKPKRQFYDYKAKYSRSANTQHIMPASLNKSEYRKVLQIAKKAHNALCCDGVTRSDFKFYKGKFYLLEINTQPGMTSLSLVPEIALYKGISFQALIKKIVLNAKLNK